MKKILLKIRRKFRHFATVFFGIEIIVFLIRRRQTVRLFQ